MYKRQRYDSVKHTPHIRRILSFLYTRHFNITIYIQSSWRTIDSLKAIVYSLNSTSPFSPMSETNIDFSEFYREFGSWNPFVSYKCENLRLPSVSKCEWELFWSVPCTWSKVSGKTVSNESLINKALPDFNLPSFLTKNFCFLTYINFLESRVIWQHCPNMSLKSPSPYRPEETPLV